MGMHSLNWTLVNRARRVLACSVSEDPSGAFVLTIELEGEVLLRECHYSVEHARERAERLRAVLAEWGR
jgi:hypothetical protein